MKKTIWVSLERLKRHEFNRTLRLTCSDPSEFVRKFQIVSNVYHSAVRQFIKLSGVLLTAYLILNSLGTETSLSLQVGSVSATVPKAYYLAVCSVFFLMTFIAFNHLVVAMNLRNLATVGVRVPGFSSAAFRMISGEDETSLGMPDAQSLFLKERLPISGLLSFLILLCIMTLLIPIFAFGIYAGTMLWQLVLLPSINLLEKASTILALAIFAISYLYCALFYLPLPYTKNTSFIRWTVLYNLPRPYPEKQISRWILDEAKGL